MNTLAHPRKKDPIKRQEELLNAARVIAGREGIAALSLNAVAREAGVSKGGLMHHFPSKQELIHALFIQLLDIMDVRIAAIMANDSDPYGRFSRAYLHYVGELKDSDESFQLALLSLAMPTEPVLRKCWRDWMLGHLAQGDAFDNGYLGALVRYAADGLWLSALTEGPTLSRQERDAIIQRLTQISFEEMH
ncbi:MULTISPECIES: TetR/AcrR family transcriptional regulator [Providencia]|uniref:TetR family transcriptional regulator n=2 Tax=Providencia alcalifaciens TaxID=126385 RepID=A0AAW9V9Q7_9GAMM|nr:MULTISPECIES: TetR/AcrR family transcriptional regulator [Providencia]EKT65397.1 TetR family transcriptional regulator [Providencia alcalifaciens Dmel2]ETT08414.1 transcriptional regulator, TetR family [Providencia alcalifaciens F90-2004]EUC97055.1 transcriptional regulator, TetR family [Providencia alcalifaciens PAL-2]EUD01936.1 transcriptional regulator, TetR family [Providencia alcalifaciens RIMD 1656011]EUD06412.1 transcriptional regulator, TetR family [Providencia alcalifaciens R90-147